MSEGFDFVALRLKPDAGVHDMKAIRVTMPGGAPSIPLRFATAGSGDRVAISLFVISEGAYVPADLTEVEVSASDVVWDWAARTSNYADVRAQALAQADAAYVTTFADAIDVPGRAYLQAAGCGAAPFSSRGVVRACVGAPEAGPVPHLGEDGGSQDGRATDDAAVAVPVCGRDYIDPSSFDCRGAQELSRALLGMHPSDVRLTRLDLSIARAAAGRDLTLVPAPATRGALEIQAGRSANAPCSSPVRAGAGTAALVLAVASMLRLTRRRSGSRAPWASPPRT